MLPSGYLIRPCEGGGSIIHIVDHMDLEVIQSNFVSYFLCNCCEPEAVISTELVTNCLCYI